MKAVKPWNIVIFVLACIIYLLVLFLFKADKDIKSSRLARAVKNQGLVANFSSQFEPFSQLLAANQRTLELTQRLNKPRRVEADPIEIISETIAYFNPRLKKRKRRALAKAIFENASEFELDPYLLTALISQESMFYARAKSSVGAYGYGQLMPATAKYLGVNRKKPKENLRGCAMYLSEQLHTWRRSRDPLAFALASYNAGPGTVAHYNGVPPYQETRNYVSIIKSRYQTLTNAAKPKLRS